MDGYILELVCIFLRFLVAIYLVGRRIWWLMFEFFMDLGFAICNCKFLCVWC